MGNLCLYRARFFTSVRFSDSNLSKSYVRMSANLIMRASFGCFFLICAYISCATTAFTGKYHDSKELGTYRCVCCNVVLFKSDKKFNSGTGWPSFSDVIDKENVEYIQDSSFAAASNPSRSKDSSAST